MKNWCVYMHENRVNGKRYIGITSQKPTRRWANGAGYKNNPHFYAAVEKYGWDGFRHELLFTGVSKNEAERLEVELIAKYQTQNPEKGYNLKGGGGVLSCSGETRSRMREAAKKRGVSPTAWEAARAFWTGRKHSQDSVEKMREAQKGRVVSTESRARLRLAAIKRRVICVETGAVYDSLIEAQRQTGIDRTVIDRCCSKKPHCNTAGGYHWQFVDKSSEGKEDKAWQTKTTPNGSPG